MKRIKVGTVEDCRPGDELTLRVYRPIPKPKTRFGPGEWTWEQAEAGDVLLYAVAKCVWLVPHKCGACTLPSRFYNGVLQTDDSGPEYWEKQATLIKRNDESFTKPNGDKVTDLEILSGVWKP